MNYKEKVKLMCEMQSSLNDHTDEKWREKNLNWALYIMMETCELIESTNGYKHWKQKTNPDIENIKVEVIDIFHFFMSYHMDMQIDTDDVEAISEIMGRYLEIEYSKSTSNKTPYDSIDLGKKLVQSVLNHSTSDTYVYMSKLIRLFFDNFDDFAKGYLVKNILNKFRQDNGYKDGTYNKMWSIEPIKNTELIKSTKYEEDNVAAFREAVSIDLDENFEQNLVTKLNQVYKRTKTLKTSKN